MVDASASRWRLKVEACVMQPRGRAEGKVLQRWMFKVAGVRSEVVALLAGRWGRTLARGTWHRAGKAQPLVVHWAEG